MGVKYFGMKTLCPSRFSKKTLIFRLLTLKLATAASAHFEEVTFSSFKLDNNLNHFLHLAVGKVHSKY